jgi:putative tryptophan/tyrosine transport system substrate-binding protein
VRRREFLGVLGGAAAAWPVAARAQQPAMPVIGLLHPASPDTFAFAGRLRGLRQGLKDIGYIEGENVAIEYRWAENQTDRLPELAADLVRRRVTVIAVIGESATVAAKAATTTIPTIFAVSEDPVSPLRRAIASFQPRSWITIRFRRRPNACDEQTIPNEKVALRSRRGPWIYSPR